MIPINNHIVNGYPKVTVLMTSCFRPARLLATLINLQRAYPSIDIVLRISATDECPELIDYMERIKDALHGFTSYKVQMCPTLDTIGSAKNALLEEAKIINNNYVFFVDDNMEVSHGAFELVLSMLSIDPIAGAAVEHSGGKCCPIYIRDGFLKECWSTLPVEAYAVLPLDFSGFRLEALDEVLFDEDILWFPEVSFCLDVRKFGPLYMIRPNEKLVHCDKSGNSEEYTDRMKEYRTSIPRLKLADIEMSEREG